MCEVEFWEVFYSWNVQSHRAYDLTIALMFKLVAFFR